MGRKCELAKCHRVLWHFCLCAYNRRVRFDVVVVVVVHQIVADCGVSHLDMRRAIVAVDTCV